jgi:hypothetical protein
LSMPGSCCIKRRSRSFPLQCIFRGAIGGTSAWRPVKRERFVSSLAGLEHSKSLEIQCHADDNDALPGISDRKRNPQNRA